MCFSIIIVYFTRSPFTKELGLSQQDRRVHRSSGRVLFWTMYCFFLSCISQMNELLALTHNMKASQVVNTIAWCMRKSWEAHFFVIFLPPVYNFIGPHAVEMFFEEQCCTSTTWHCAAYNARQDCRATTVLQCVVCICVCLSEGAIQFAVSVLCLIDRCD